MPLSEIFKNSWKNRFYCVSTGGVGDGDTWVGMMTLTFFFFNFIYLFIYLFMAVLGLRFCARVFSSCGKWGPLFIAVRGASHYRGLSCCGAQAPDAQAQ